MDKDNIVHVFQPVRRHVLLNSMNHKHAVHQITENAQVSNCVTLKILFEIIVVKSYMAKNTNFSMMH